MIRVHVASAAICMLLAGCGSTPRAAMPSAPDTAAESLAELRYRLAADPSNQAARRALGMMQAQQGIKGAALRNLMRVHRVSSVAGNARKVLARLLVERARARVTAKDLGAVKDLALAQRLDRTLSVAKSLHSAAYANRVAVLLSHPDSDRREQGGALLTRLLALSPTHALAALAQPSRASAPELARALHWLDIRGAKRLTVNVGKHYWQRKGRSAAVMRPYIRAHNWWHGITNPPDLLMMNELARAGLRVCDVARVPEQYGCGLELDRIAASATRSQRVMARARQLFWSTSDPRAAGAWTTMSLRAWMFGSANSWLGELAKRVDLRAVSANAEQVPLYARATVLRAAGANEAAKVAIKAALATQATLPRVQRAVVLAEAALQGHAAVAKTIIAGAAFDELGWRVALVVARVNGWEAALLAKVPTQHLATYLRATGRLAPTTGANGDPIDQLRYSRWWQILKGAPAVRAATLATWSRLRSTTTAPVVKFTVATADLLTNKRLRKAVTDGFAGALLRIARAHKQDPALAQRLAAEFADKDIRIAGRGAIVAELFRQLGDHKRAHDWQAAVVARNKHSIAQLFAGAVVAAEAWQLRLARQLFTTAAVWSSDAGAIYAHAAQTFVRLGKPIDALVEARFALRHIAAGQEQQVLAAIIMASLQLKRVDDATRTAKRWIARTPAAFRDAARAHITQMWPQLRARLPGKQRVDWAPGRRNDPSDLAAALTTKSVARLLTVHAWNPYDVRAAARLVATLPPTDVRFKALVGQLLASVMMRCEQHLSVPADVIVLLNSIVQTPVRACVQRKN